MNPPDFEIDEVTDLDSAWPDIRRLFLQLREYEQGPESLDLRPDWETRFRARLGEEKRSGGVVVIARARGRAMGFMTAHVEDSNLFVSPRCEVTYACVTDGWRSNGVGRAMLSRVEAWSRDAGVDEVWLEVLAANAAAVRAWESMGFRPRSHAMRKALR